jgi:PAS domain S-box-containing protein
MKISLIFVSFCVLIAGILQPSKLIAEITVKVGVYQNKPLIFEDDRGKIKGIFVDILTHVADEEGWTLEYISDSWSEGLNHLKSGQIDVMGPIAYSQERNKIFDFSYINVLTNWGQIYINKNSDIESILDLREKKVAVLQNDVYYQNLRKLVRQFGIECRFIEAFGYDTVLKLVEMGKCEAGLVGYLYGHQFERDFDIYKTSIILSPQRIHFAVPKGKNRNIIDALDFNLSKLKEDKQSIYYQSINKWIGVDSRPENKVWYLIMLGGAGCLALIFFALNLVLRAKVRKRTEELQIKNRTLSEEIEQRKKVESALYENEKEYRSVFENTGTATIIVEEDMVISKVNATAEEMIGYSKDEIEGKMKTGEFVAGGEDLEKIIKYHFDRRKPAAETPSEYTINIVDRHGNTKNAFIQVSIIPGTKKSIASLVDITSRIQAEEALRKSEEKYRTILENIEEGYFEIDLKGNLKFINNSLCKITGYTREELIGKNYKQYSNPATAQEMFQVFKELYRAGKSPIVGCFEIANKDGRAIAIELSPTPIKSPDGKVNGFRGMIRDITERKMAEQDRRKLEEQLQQAQKMKAVGTLAGGVAHDLNNILSGVVSYPDLILMDLPEDSPLREPISTIQDSGKKAAAIVQDLLTLARRGVSVSEIVNLNDVISEYLISPELEKLKSFHPQVKLETFLDPALLNLKGSPVHLSKTLMNLVSNASEAMTDGGTVIIKTENKYVDEPISGYDEVEEGDYVVLTVSDTGVGIAKDEIGRIFEPFYTKKVMGRSGTGLGMAVVWGTVKDHNGYIHVESSQGEGTRFKLYFPVTRKKKTKDHYPLSLNDYRGKGESILVVDDIKEQREIASNILMQLGYSVDTVSSGEEAVEFMKTHTADILVLDMIMPPGIDGLEAYKQILAENPGQKAIIASGFSETDRVRKAQDLGAGKYIKKPYTIEKIGLAVRAELEKNQEADLTVSDKTYSKHWKFKNGE